MTDLAIDKIQDEIWNIYKQHGEKPMLLSQLGEQLRSVTALPEGYRLSELIKIIDGLEITYPGKSGVPYVYSKPSLKESDLDRIVLSQIRKSILSAFTVPLRADEQIYLSLSYPYTYSRHRNKAKQPYVIVENKYRIITEELDIDTMQDSIVSQLLGNIKSWSNEHSVGDEIIYWTTKKDIEIKTNITSNALERLLAAQDVDVRSKLLIPGDIAEILIKHS
ncbi:hypothetical protein LJC59_00390 [Desulfovibrio sp. OttesenSCG-928-A18]|nr:hypothetical protein [Desulfovibrio sp. OttesenSCG-928-A18]